MTTLQQQTNSKVKEGLNILLKALLILPILLVGAYFFKFHSLKLSSNHSDWGNFGGYLGGTLGIVLSGISIYLLYKTYLSQKKQISLQENESKIRYVDLQYTQIINDINDISFGDKKGSNALYSWNESHTISPNNVVNSLTFITHTFSVHISTIKELDEMHDSIKDQLLIRAYLMFHSKIIWPVLAKLYNDSAFQNHHDNLFDNFEKLTIETYTELLKHKKLTPPTDERVISLLNRYWSNNVSSK